MSAWVSPPQLTSSYIVQTTASMAQAASTALPPRSNILAPAVAPRGLPVTATQWRPCRTGFCVAENGSAAVSSVAIASHAKQSGMKKPVFMMEPHVDDDTLERRVP